MSRRVAQTHNELKRTHLIFQKMLDISSDGFLIIDEKGLIIEINKAYLEFLALRREDVLGKYVIDIIKNSKLPEILLTGETEVNVLHKLAEGQAPNKEKVVAVTRAAVKNGQEVIAAVGQIKFSNVTQALAQKLHRMDVELQYYKSELKRIVGAQYSFENMVGHADSFHKVKALATKASHNDFNVLIIGETGTGKEVFAHAIHNGSSRSSKPFIRVNCAAIPSELLEAELFGYEEGSFTGAKKGGKKGKFELADGGTIFLDEIGDMPLVMQAKLLRVLQERQVEKIGAYHPMAVDVRVIAATNQNLEERVAAKAFRADLFYRLNVIQIRVPPLRERPEDISLFANYFLDELNDSYGTRISISASAEKVLSTYLWPGNVRELKNTIERAYSIVEGDVILNAHLPANIIGKVTIGDLHRKGRNLDGLMADIEREILTEALRENKNNFQATARELGIHRSTLYKKFEKLNIDKTQFQ